MEQITKQEAAAAYVRHFTGHSASDEALEEYALQAYVGTYRTMTEWALEAMADMTEEELGGRDTFDFINDVHTQGGGTVDFIPTDDGLVLVFDENMVAGN